MASPKVAKITSGRSAMATQSSTRPMATRRPGNPAVDQLDRLRQQIADAVAKDGVRVPAQTSMICSARPSRSLARAASISM